MSVRKNSPERKVLMDGSLALELDLIEGKLVKGSSSNQGRTSPTLGQPSQECSSACKTGRDKEKNEAAERPEDRPSQENELKQLVEAVFDR